MSSNNEKKSKKKNSEDKESHGLGQSSSDDALVINELKSLYKEKLLPIENNYLFNRFGIHEILDAEILAKPTVLLVGKYKKT